MIENVNYSENINNMGGDGASLPPSSKVNTASDVKTELNLEKKVQTEVKETVQKEQNEPEVKVDSKELNELIDRLNEKLSLSNREIIFKTEKKINKHYVSVVDKESQEVIKEWPPKEIRKFLIGLKELEDKLGSNKDIENLIVNLEV